MNQDVYPSSLARITCGDQKDKGLGLLGPDQLSGLLEGW